MRTTGVSLSLYLPSPCIEALFLGLLSCCLVSQSFSTAGLVTSLPHLLVKLINNTSCNTQVTEVLICAGQPGAQDAHTTQHPQQLLPISHAIATRSRAQMFLHELLAIAKVLSCLAPPLTDSIFLCFQPFGFQTPSCQCWHDFLLHCMACCAGGVHHPV